MTDASVIVDGGGNRFSNNASGALPNNCVPVFGVENVESSRSALEAEGIEFDGDIITAEGMVKITTFYDPDRNALMLAEDLTKG